MCLDKAVPWSRILLLGLAVVDWISLRSSCFAPWLLCLVAGWGRRLAVMLKVSVEGQRLELGRQKLFCEDAQVKPYLCPGGPQRGVYL